MIYPYSNAKTGGVGWVFDTDLGIQTDFTPNTDRIARTPAKGEIATMELILTANQGGGYSSGSNQPETGIMTSNNDLVDNNIRFSIEAGLNDVITFAATGGTGNGATFIGTTVYRIGSLNADLPFSFGPTPGPTATTTLDGTTKGITGIAANGAGANFIVTAVGGLITSVIVEASTPTGALLQGTGYIIGEPIEISKAAMDTDGSLGVVSGSITVFPTIDHVTNGANIIKVLNGGSGYTVGDTLSLTQISPVQKGTVNTTELATVDVATLGTASTIVTAPNNIYPVAIRCATGTIAGPETIEFVGLDDENVIIGGFTAGTILPFQFKQIAEIGTTAIEGDITILY